MPCERVELWVRSASSWTVGRDGTFVDDLAALPARGVVEDYEVVVTDGQVPLDPDLDVSPREATVRARVREIKEWADGHGYDLPAFRRTRAVPRPDGSDVEVQVLPLAVLAGFEGERLTWMAPYSDGDRHVSVQDKLDELARRSPSDPDDGPEKAVAVAD